MAKKVAKKKLPKGARLADRAGEVWGDLTLGKPSKTRGRIRVKCGACGKSSEMRFQHIAAGQTHCGCQGKGQAVRQSKGQPTVSSSGQKCSKAAQAKKKLRQVDVAESLRTQQLTRGWQEELAKKHKVTPTTISHDLAEILAVSDEDIQGHRAIARGQQLHIVQKLIEEMPAHFTYVDQDGNVRFDAAPANVLLKALERQAKLLGLDLKEKGHDEDDPVHTLETLRDLLGIAQEAGAAPPPQLEG